MSKAEKKGLLIDILLDILNGTIDGDKLMKVGRAIKQIEELFENLEEKTSQPISELDLSHRIRICFEILNIKTIADITEHTAREFYIMRNIGKKSFKRIERILKDNGLEFKPRTHRR